MIKSKLLAKACKTLPNLPHCALATRLAVILWLTLCPLHNMCFLLFLERFLKTILFSL